MSKLKTYDHQEFNEKYDQIDQKYQNQSIQQIFTQFDDQIDKNCNFQDTQEYFNYLYNNNQGQNFKDKNILKIFQSTFLQSIQVKLLKSKKIQKSSTFSSKFIINQIKPTKYYQIVVLQIQLGWYKTKIQILNLQKQRKSQLHKCSNIKKFGAFGNIYFIQFQHQKYAVKCIKTDPSNLSKGFFVESNIKNYMSIFHEYFFGLLFSQLEIGPKIKKYLGFDLVISDQCVEFSTQLCTQLVLEATSQQQMKQELRIMHGLNIAHRDIKRENIMYSSIYKKAVFIDFGCCILLNQQIGQKSFTTFVGTTMFCSQDMLNLIGDHSGYVDLYYNDAYALKKTFKLFNGANLNIQNKREFSFQISKNELQIGYDIATVIKNQQIFLNFVKYLFFTKKHQQILYYWNLFEIIYPDTFDNLQCQLLRFFIDIQPNQFTLNFYWNHLKLQIRSLKQFQDLKHVFTNKLDKFSLIWLQFPIKKQYFQRSISIYKDISLYTNYLTDSQGQIHQILQSKSSIQIFILQSKSKQIEKINLSTYSIAAISYCTLTHNNYNVNIDKKVRVAIQFIKKFKQKDTKKSIYSELIFKPNQKPLQPLALMFQFFIFQFLKHCQIQQKFRSQVIHNGVSSLILLGFPVYLYGVSKFLIYHIISLQKDKTDQIIIFWKIKSLILIYKDAFYKRSETSIFISLTENQEEINNFLQNLMTSSFSNESSQFIKTNNEIYSIFNDGMYQNIEVTCYRDTLQLLLKRQYIQNIAISKQKYQIWRQNVYLFVASIYISIMTFQSGQNSKQIRIFNSFSQNNHTIKLFFYPLAQYYHLVYNFNRLKLALKIIDSQFDNEIMGKRMLVHARIAIAYFDKDFESIKVYLKWIAGQFSNFAQHNVIHFYKFHTLIRSLCLQQKMSFDTGFTDYYPFIQTFQGLIQNVIQYGKYEINKYLFQLQNLNNIGQCIRRMIFVINCSLSMCSQIMGLVRQINNQKKSYWTFLQSGYTKSSGNRTQNLKQILDKNQRQEKGIISEKTRIQVKADIRRLLKGLYENKKVVAFLQENPKIQKHLYVIQLSIYGEKPHLTGDLMKMIQKRQGTLSKEQIIHKKQTNKIITQSSIYKEIIFVYHYWVLQRQNYSKQACSKFLQISQLCEFQDTRFQLIFQKQNMKLLFNCYVHAQKSFEQIQNYLLKITNYLRLSPSQHRISIFNWSMRGLFSCKCKFCFKRSPQNWNMIGFTQYLCSKINEKSYSLNCYMALIYYYSLMSSQLHQLQRIKSKLMKFISYSMEYLHPFAKEIISEQFYKLANQSYFYRKTINGIKLKNYLNSTTSELQFPNNSINILISGQQMNERQRTKQKQKIVSLIMKKTWRHKKIAADIKILQQNVNSRLNQRSLYDHTWKIPQKFKQLYHKKLFKYFEYQGF